MNSKKILFLVGFIVLVVAFGALIYFVFIKDLVSPGNDDANANVNAVNANAATGLPVTNGAANVNVVSIGNLNATLNINTAANVNRAQVTNVAQGSKTLAEAVVSAKADYAVPAATGPGLRYYDENEGKFYSLDALGNAKQMSNQIFPEAKDINWSPKGNKAIVTFPDNSKVMYDFDSQNQVTIPKEWDDVEFSNSGEQIGFKNVVPDEDARWLAVSKPDGTEVELIEPLGDKQDDVDVNWSPSSQVMALFRKAYSGTAQEVYLIGLHGENFKSLETDGRGFEGLWSPDGSQLLYNVYSASTNYNPSLFLVDAAGDQVGAFEMDLGLKTWVSKCTFSGTAAVLYCAVPANLAVGSGIYPEAAVNTNDIIYQVNINTGTKSIVALPTFLAGDRDYTINSLFLSNDDKTLYFNDANTGRIYSIQLP